jgi:hypothetical protein
MFSLSKVLNVSAKAVWRFGRNPRLKPGVIPFYIEKQLTNASPPFFDRCLFNIGQAYGKE